MLLFPGWRDFQPAGHAWTTPQEHRYVTYSILHFLYYNISAWYILKFLIFNLILPVDVQTVEIYNFSTMTVIRGNRRSKQHSIYIDIDANRHYEK